MVPFTIFLIWVVAKPLLKYNLVWQQLNNTTVNQQSVVFDNSYCIHQHWSTIISGFYDVPFLVFVDSTWLFIKCHIPLEKNHASCGKPISESYLILLLRGVLLLRVHHLSSFDPADKWGSPRYDNLQFLTDRSESSTRFNQLFFKFLNHLLSFCCLFVPCWLDDCEPSPELSVGSTSGYANI